MTIYLVRHGEPNIGFGKKHICLGRKDLPLSHEGEKQAERLSRYFREKDLDAIYSSPLNRCQQTARILRDLGGHKELEIRTEESLAEMDMGEWDGLSFTQIRETDPQAYVLRGQQIGTYRVPGGESFQEAGERFAEGFRRILQEEGPSKNLLIVAHAGVIRAFLTMLLHRDMDAVQTWQLPYASVTVLQLPEAGEEYTKQEAGAEDRYGRIPGTEIPCRITSSGLRPVEAISLSEVDRIWAQCGVEQSCRAHMEMVADTAMNMIEYDFARVSADLFDTAYCYRGALLNTRIIYYAALLHDICRPRGRGHEAAGADLLLREGYQELEKAVRMHNDPQVWEEGAPLTEAEIVYYADKLVRGEQLVSLEERFAGSLARCKTPEALAMHQKRLEAARGIAKKLGEA